MKREFKALLIELAHTAAKSKALVPDFEHYSDVFKRHHINFSNRSVKKMWMLMKGKHHFSRETLDRFALLAGFQSWDDLDKAIHGDTDASINYRD